MATDEHGGRAQQEREVPKTGVPNPGFAFTIALAALVFYAWRSIRERYR